MFWTQGSVTRHLVGLVGAILSEWLRGGWFEGDLVPEGFEFVDESAFPCFRVVGAAGEVVRAQVAVGGGLGQYMPNDHNEGVGGGGGGLLSALLAEPAVEATELGADVGAGASGGPGALGENRAQLAVMPARCTRRVPCSMTTSR